MQDLKTWNQINPDLRVDLHGYGDGTYSVIDANLFPGSWVRTPKTLFIEMMTENTRRTQIAEGKPYPISERMQLRVRRSWGVVTHWHC